MPHKDVPGKIYIYMYTKDCGTCERSWPPVDKRRLVVQSAHGLPHNSCRIIRMMSVTVTAEYYYWWKTHIFLDISSSCVFGDTRWDEILPTLVKHQSTLEVRKADSSPVFVVCAESQSFEVHLQTVWSPSLAHVQLQLSWYINTLNYLEAGKAVSPCFW